MNFDKTDKIKGAPVFEKFISIHSLIYSNSRVFCVTKSIYIILMSQETLTVILTATVKLR